MILDALGEKYSSEFTKCGHTTITSQRDATTIVEQLRSGAPAQVRAGLHSLAGHAGPIIGPTLGDHRKDLADVALGVAAGSFSPDDHGRLLAASQYQTAHIGREIQQLVTPDSILQVYHAAVGSPRVQENSDFQSWMVGTSIAALRESSSPTSAADLLREVLKKPTLASDIHRQGSSQLRLVLILAAPTLCMPELFKCYELALIHGSAEERSLALVNVKQLPGVITALGATHPARVTLLQWCSRYQAALERVLDTSKACFVDPLRSSSSSKRFFERSDILNILEQLRRTTETGSCDANH
jgi:hypothetical protein